MPFLIYGLATSHIDSVWSHEDGFRPDTLRHDLMERPQGILIYLKIVSWRLVLACLASFGIALGMIILFRMATEMVVWCILWGTLAFGLLGVSCLWYLYNYTNDDVWQKCAIFATLFYIVLLCMILFLYRRIKLIIVLLKEAMKAAFAMPLLIFIPILTMVAFLLIAVVTVITSIHIFSNVNSDDGINGVTLFTGIFNIFVALWALQFVLGIQYMIIAGAVSEWYFIKHKENLDSPISKSAYIIFKYHLGSTALGSLILTGMVIIRGMLHALAKFSITRQIVVCYMANIEKILKILSKNAYILIAMHGQPFITSGKRAATIILKNALNIVALNYVGNFVLGMIQLITVLISMGITYGIMQGAEDSYIWIIYLIVLFASLIISGVLFVTVEAIMDTIFLCFCEDSLLNDGISRPYAMSRDLMEFVENSKKICAKKALVTLT